MARAKLWMTSPPNSQSINITTNVVRDVTTVRERESLILRFTTP